MEESQKGGSNIQYANAHPNPNHPSGFYLIFYGQIVGTIKTARQRRDLGKMKGMHFEFKYGRKGIPKKDGNGLETLAIMFFWMSTDLRLEIVK
jgi:hypothetical protein